MSFSNLRIALFLGMVAVAPGSSQGTSKPDILILIDGEKLIGHLESADASNILFKSDLAGEVKVAWAKVQSLQSSAKFAIAQKGENFGRDVDPSTVPQGTVSVADQKVTITQSEGAPVVIPVERTQNVIPQAGFLRAFSHPRLREYWSGAASGGLALVDATETSKTFSTALSLVRTVPSESWMSPRYRTTLTFNSAHGTTTSGPVTIKTDIIHGGVEQDEYLNPRLFFFGQGSADHNYSQGLRVEYTLGSGLGVVAYKDAHQELDFKSQVAYTNQIFAFGDSTHLIGSVFGQIYNRSFTRDIVLHEELSVTPAFNQLNDYSGTGLLNLGLPITRHLNFTVGLVDSYLNDPPPGFRKNSFQFLTNITYKIN